MRTPMITEILVLKIHYDVNIANKKIYISSNDTFVIISRLTQYGTRCDWLKDDKFLRDLEGDSVDTEILDEELRSLQDEDSRT